MTIRQLTPRHGDAWAIHMQKIGRAGYFPVICNNRNPHAVTDTWEEVTCRTCRKKRPPNVP